MRTDGKLTGKDGKSPKWWFIAGKIIELHGGIFQPAIFECQGSFSGAMPGRRCAGKLGPADGGTGMAAGPGKMV